MGQKKENIVWPPKCSISYKAKKEELENGITIQLLSNSKKDLRKYLESKGKSNEEITKALHENEEVEIEK